MKQKYCLVFGIIAIIGIILVSGCVQEPSGTKKLKVGEHFTVDVQSPHPYPNSKGGRDIVWSYTLSHPDATFLRLHFDKIEINGRLNTPEIYETIDYGPCEVAEESSSESGKTAVGEEKRCGNQTVLKTFTPQEIFDNNYIEGDFLLIRNKEGKVVDIITRGHQLQRLGNWSHVYPTDTITLLIYADESENAYGIHIDKYSAGLRNK